MALRVHFGLKAVRRSGFPRFPDPGNVLLEPLRLSLSRSFSVPGQEVAVGNSANEVARGQEDTPTIGLRMSECW